MEEDNANASCSTKHNVSSFGIHIDINAIHSIDTESRANELQHLDVNVYEQNRFEEDVIQQVDTVISEAEKNFKRNILRKEIENLEQEVKNVQTEKEDIDKVFSSANFSNNEGSHNISFSLLQRKKSKENQLKKVVDQLKETKNQLLQLETLSKETGYVDSSLLGPTKAHNDAVRLGEMTPFDALKALQPTAGQSTASETSNSVTSTDGIQIPIRQVKHPTSVNTNKKSFTLSDDEYIPEDNISSDGSEIDDIEKEQTKKKGKYVHAKKSKKTKVKPKKILDDGNFDFYKERIKKLSMKKRLKEACKAGEVEEEYNSSDFSEDTDEEDDVAIEDEMLLPRKVWNRLYKYQRVGIKWLWQLHKQQAGGIVADEMGLGKTIQIIAFLAGLSYSKKGANKKKFGLGATLIVCPATVMHQWVAEFQKWWPKFRVAILHDSGSFTCKKATLIRAINNHPGVLITSYAGLRLNKVELYRYEWQYVILDEGHKIRNPDSDVTLACKHFDTPHRLILTGTPMQNSLKELWSLFDFVFPGKLGTLAVFMAEFSVPITMGGYSNASTVQVQTAYKCSCVLRDTIGPYILRRMKKDVQLTIELPSKSEQVLFCKLSEEQRDLYKQYINSHEVENMLNGKIKVFAGLIKLRKICNHPDLAFLEPLPTTSNSKKKNTPVKQQTFFPTSYEFESGYGYWKRSGKMVVVETLLRLWKEQGHRVLVFTQSRQMLSILQTFVESLQYKYLIMDGTTNIGSRQTMVKQFNENLSIFVFLLTTRVGGLGLNLIGANRVLIYDPDWNPSTDSQARERAWRIGQKRDVTIYRLMTTGTIEEKIYHRQIFKQFLTNRVLTNPFQRRFFKSNDLYELFTLGDIGPMQSTETGAIFAGTGSEIRMRKKGKNKNKQTKLLPSIDTVKSTGVNNADVDVSTSSNASAMKCSTTSTIKDRKKIETNNVSTRNKSSVNKDKNKKRKKLKRKKIEVDGHLVENVDKSEAFKQVKENDEDQSENDVLMSLFRTSGIHSALKHDRIEQSGNPDYVLVEKEAERVAKHAVEALRKSREHYHSSTASRFSSGNNNENNNRKKPRFGKSFSSSDFLSSSNIANKPNPITKSASSVDVSSNALLARMKKRNLTMINTPVVESEISIQSSSTNVEPNELFNENLLLGEIQSFISNQVNRQSTTDSLITNFQSRIPNGRNALFKELLKQICCFERSDDGGGVWKLKDEFT